jgi:hypothetical protein
MRLLFVQAYYVFFTSGIFHVDVLHVSSCHTHSKSSPIEALGAFKTLA